MQLLLSTLSFFVFVDDQKEGVDARYTTKQKMDDDYEEEERIVIVVLLLFASWLDSCRVVFI